MWRTQLGERTLKGAEWEPFWVGLCMLRDQVESGIEWDDPGVSETEVEGFDRLEPNQKLAMLALVATALSSDDVPAPMLTAVTEAAVAAVFSMIRMQTAMEIEQEADLTQSEDPDDASSPYYWRALLLAAYPEVEALQEAKHQAMIAERPPPEVFVMPAWLEGIDEEYENQEHEGEVDEEPPFQVPDVTSKDAIAWEVMVDVLTDAVLWGDRDYDMDAEFLDAPPARKKALARQMGIDEEYFLGIAPDPSERELEEIRAVLKRICGGGGPQ